MTKTDRIRQILSDPATADMKTAHIARMVDADFSTVALVRKKFDKGKVRPSVVVSPTIKVPISNIIISDRHRKDLGDIEGLASSIAERGLLHPPVVTEDNTLVCGYRRVEAMRRLGYQEIEVRVFNPDDMTLAERDENEVRKDFTPSEKVAIKRTVEERIGNRRGQRTDLNGPAQLPGNCPEVAPGTETRDFAAKVAGFDNDRTFRRAAEVVDHGIPALVEQMDQEEVSVSAAAEVAQLPEPIQKSIVSQGPAAVQSAAQTIRKSRSRNGNSGIVSLPGTEIAPVVVPPVDPNEDQHEKNADAWSKFFGDFYILLSSIQRRGGITNLARRWPPGGVQQAITNLENFRSTIDECLVELRGLLP